MYLDKLLAQLAYPLALCLLLVPTGWLVARRQPKLGSGLAAFGLLWLLLWSLPVPSFWLRASLERQFPQRAAASYPVTDAIVVLGGGVSGARPGWRDRPDLSAAGDRVWFGARLYRAGRAPVVILSGGASAVSDSPEPEADAMAAFIEDLGVPAGALLLERHSRNTWENAVDVHQILRDRHIGTVLLVTSALHMPRAMAVFRKQGIDAIPAPADFEAVPPRVAGLLRWLPDTDALEASTRAIKEYLGLWVYRLRGRAAG